MEGSYVELTGKSGGGDCIERTSLNCSGGGNNGGAVNSVSGNSNNDSGVSNDYNLQLKSEPIGGPGTPDSLTELGAHSDDCAGCGQLIQVNTSDKRNLGSCVLICWDIPSIHAGSLLLECGGEAMARGMSAVLHVSPVVGGRDQLLFAGREYLLQDGLLSVSGDKITGERISGEGSVGDELSWDKNRKLRIPEIRCHSRLIKSTERNLIGGSGGRGSSQVVVV